MTWEQKLEAIEALCGITTVNLQMRKPGDWYVSAGMSISKDGISTSSYGNGKTPEEAVNDHWNIYAVNLPPELSIILGYTADKKYRWNGFMWREVQI
jgi:hypothetical protein